MHLFLWVDWIFSLLDHHIRSFFFISSRIFLLSLPIHLTCLHTYILNIFFLCVLILFTLFFVLCILHNLKSKANQINVLCALCPVYSTHSSAHSCSLSPISSLSLSLSEKLFHSELTLFHSITSHHVPQHSHFQSPSDSSAHKLHTFNIYPHLLIFQFFYVHTKKNL